jgi:hypothetical protein
MKTHSSGFGPIILLFVGSFLFGISLLAGVDPASAEYTPGKTYDQSNYQEIQDLLAPPLLNWVKKGEFILKTGELDYEWTYKEDYLEAGFKNEGKFDFNEKGAMIEKQTGEPVAYYRGLPFPKIDMKAPKAGQQILENMLSVSYSNTASHHDKSRTFWIGLGGKERELVVGAHDLYYTNRLTGPIPNPSGYLKQGIYNVREPFELRGTITMLYRFNDGREDSSFSYVPMLRRVVRTSAASRSDPFMGSDICNDDAYGFDGNPASMDVKMIGEKRILAPMTAAGKTRAEDMPDGSINHLPVNYNMGFEVKGWKGAPWAPVDIVWALRPTYIIELNPKDPYYNYGKQLLYIDQSMFNCFFKEIYDRAGEYWKMMLVGWSIGASPKGLELLRIDPAVLVIDDKAHHASLAELRLPLPELKFVPIDPSDYTLSNIYQLSK